MKKSVIIISSVVFLALFAGSSFAFGPGMGIRNEGCQSYGEENAWTDLSKEQKDDLAALRQKFIDETYELKISKLQKHQEMRLLMATSNPDRAKLIELSQQIQDIEKQYREKQIDFQLNAKKISPEIGLGRGFCQQNGKWADRGRGRGCVRNQEGGCPYNN